MGLKQDDAWDREPQLRLLYEDYLVCRNQVFVTFRKPDGRKGEERQVVVPFTTGLNFLPDSGGLNDQNFITSRIFAAFLRGDQQASIRLMNR